MERHFIYLFVYLFVYLFMAVSSLSCGTQDFSLRCMGSFFIVACGLLSIVGCGLLSSCGTWAPESVGSVTAAHGLSSCGVRAQ